jgi:threonine synthase
VCLETAMPIKFADTLTEALGADAARVMAKELAASQAMERLPQRFEVIDVDANRVKQYISSHTA